MRVAAEHLAEGSWRRPGGPPGQHRLRQQLFLGGAQPLVGVLETFEGDPPCFDGVHQAVSGSTMSLDFTITASSFEGYVPHLKVDWNGSENNYDLVSANMVAVPEPETYAMLLAGIGAMGFLARRRQAQQKV